MHIKIHLRQTINKMTVWGCNQLNQPTLRCCSGIQSLQPGQTIFQPQKTEGEFFISHFHCSITTVTQAVIPYKCKKKHFLNEWCLIQSLQWFALTTPCDCQAIWCQFSGQFNSGRIIFTKHSTTSERNFFHLQGTTYQFRALPLGLCSV